MPVLTADDHAYLARLDNMRLVQDAAYQRADGARAARIAALARTYPGISPGLAFSLGSAGYGPGERAEQLWQAEMSYRLNQLPGLRRRKRFISQYNREARSAGMVEMGPMMAELPPKYLKQFAAMAEGVREVRHPSVGRRVREAVDTVLQGAAWTPKKAIEIATASLEGPHPLDSYSYKVPVVSDVMEQTKEDVRNIAIGAAAPLEYIIGLSRAYLRGIHRQDKSNPPLFGGYVEGNPFQWFVQAAEQTTAFQAFGRGLETGEGFLPDFKSAALREQARMARKYSPYLIGGHAWTPGRALADIVFEPGDFAFDVMSGLTDAGIAWGLDPVNIALDVWSAWRQAKRFVEADELIDLGVVRGRRKRFLPTRFSVHIQTPKAQEALDVMLTKSPYDVWLDSARAGKPIPAYTPDGKPLLAMIDQAGTKDELIGILKDQIGGGGVLPHGIGVKQRATERLWEDIPGVSVHVGPFMDMNDVIHQLHAVMINMHWPYEIRKDIFNRLAYAGTRAEAWDEVMNIMGEIGARQLIDVGAPPELMDAWQRVFRQHWEDVQAYIKDVTAGDTLFQSDSVIIGGVDEGMSIFNPGPYTSELAAHRFGDIATEEQLFSHTYYFPDYRWLRQVTGPLREITSKGLWRNTQEAVDAFMSVWRRLTIGTAATGARVVGDEQARIAAYGFASAFRHPLTAMSYIIANSDNRWIGRLQSRPITKPIGDFLLEVKQKVGRRPSVVIDGEFPWMEEPLRGALYKRFQSITADRHVYLGGFTRITNLSDPLAPVGLAETLMHLREDAIAMSILNHGLEATIESFWSGPLRRAREWWGGVPQYAYLLHDRGAAEAFIRGYARNVDLALGGNTELAEAVRTGFVRGRRVMDPHGPNRRALKVLEDILREGENLPPAVVVSRQRTLSANAAARTARRMDNVLNYIVDSTMTRPSNYWSRNLMVQQSFQETLREAFPHMLNSARKKVLRKLKDANLPRKVVREFEEMDYRISRYNQAHIAQVASNPLSFEAAGMLAAWRANQEVKYLLYDLSKKSQAMDLLRAAAPFGEAWREVLTRWMKLTWENPRVLRRLQQVVMGARSTESNAIYEALGFPDPGSLEGLLGLSPVGQGGFLYKDQFGQEVFGYPGSAFIMRLFTGVPIPLKGRLSGLNMVVQGIPLAGPVAQIPLAWFLPDKPSWDFIRDAVFPYGTPKNLEDYFLPGYLRQFVNAFKNPNTDKLYASTVMDIARYKMSTGEYDLQGPNAQDEMNRLLSDSKKAAPRLYMVRALGQYTLPSAPSPEWLVYDKRGRLTLLWAAAKWYWDKVDKVGYDQAYEEFIDFFGADNFLIPQGKSKATIPHPPATTDAFDWMRNHPDIVEDYPNIHGVLAPATGEQSTEAYEEQFEKGWRKQLTPEKMVRMANHRLATLVYNRVKDQVGDDLNAEQEAILRAFRNRLIQEFPGYLEKPVDFTSSVVLIAELERAANDPRLRYNKAVQGLRRYLAVRKQVLDAGFVPPFDSDRERPIRIALRAYGEKLLDRNPSFQPMWDTIFMAELRSKDDEEAAEVDRRVTEVSR